MLKIIDLAILTTFSLFISLVSLSLKFNFLTYTLLLFGIPAIYLMFRNQNQVKKVTIFSVIISLPFTLILDYLVSKDKGWHIVSSVFSTRLFDIVVFEQFAWGFIFTLYATLFYEHFLDKKVKKNPIITRRMRSFAVVLFAFLGLFIYAVINYSQLIFLPYAYIVTGTTIGIIPLISFLLHYPKLRKRFLEGVLYFSFITFINEVVSLKLNHWIFPGDNFIGKTILFGFTVPYEEVIFYIILFTPILFTYYEFLDDDRK